MITPLHNHSMYSSLDGFSTPEEIAERMVQLECPCCGLTDHGVVTGHLHFDKAMRKAGIKPIFGSELYHGVKYNGFVGQERDQSHLIALAMTDEGLRNLWCLVDSTAREDHFRYVGRVFFDDIRKFHKGIKFTSACAGGLVPKGLLRGDTSAANEYLDILGDDFCIEISTYPSGSPFRDKDLEEPYDMRVINELLIEFAQERGIMMVYGDDGHYAFPEQFEVHDAYLARQTKQSILVPVEERKMHHPAQAVVIKDEAQIRENLFYVPDNILDEIMANTRALAEQADAHLPEVHRHLPAFIPVDCPWLVDEQKDLTPEALFIDLVQDGIVERYGEDASDEVWDRAFYEVETLLRDGIHHYFLMGWDEMQIAKALGIERGPGRGSSAGCIVAYALGITDVDPIHYDLLFERFWNSGRAKGFPDIDSDFSRARRPEIIAKLKERYGSDKVAAIGTTGYLKPKAVVDKLAPACEITFAEANALKEIVGKTTKIEILGHEQIGWSRELEPGKKYYVEEDCGGEIEQWIKSDRSRSDLRRYFVDLCRVCCSRVSQYGIHASGIVISDVPIADQLPTYMRGDENSDKKQPATMFDMQEVDNRMFVKLDVLGLRTLDVLEFWRDAMKAKYDIDVEWSGLDKQEHPQEMWDMLREGFTAGIFQVEDGYGKQLCKMMQPSSILDMSALNALNRPGPIQAGIPDMYCARRNGDEPITYPHPRFEELMGAKLAETYGLFVYQEQIIAFFNALDYTLGESDAIRKIMGKKKPEQMDAVRDGTEEWEGRGYLDMAVTAGIPLDIAQRIWNDLEGFADYCFNKSHSVAYGIIGFRTLYAKYYGMADFTAACIRSLDPSRDKKKRETMLPLFINECRRLKIQVRPPSIEQSMGYPYVGDDGNIYFGFGDIKDVGNSSDYIIYLRDELNFPIDSAESFRKAFEQLNVEWNAEKKRLTKLGQWDKDQKSPKQRLTSNKIDALEKADVFGDKSMSMTERQKLEMELLHVMLSDNSGEVMERHAEEFADMDSYEEANKSWDSKWDSEDRKYFEYVLPGVVSNVVEKFTRKDQTPFGIITIEHEGQELQFTVWSKEWKKSKFLFRMRTPGVYVIQHRPDNQYGSNYTFDTGKLLK